MLGSWWFCHRSAMQLLAKRQTTAPAALSNAAHLLRRAAWGGTPAEIEAAASQPLAATVDALLDQRNAPLAGSPNVRPVGDRPFGNTELNLWWWNLVTSSPTPAIERLMWFWQGHFATSTDKVEYAHLMHRQYVTLRRLSLGRFEDLLMAMTLDPAMNLWLDLHLSEVGSPNENFARELLELFSMGVNNGYTQDDVVDAGRALTGYRLRYNRTNSYVVDTDLWPEFHDHGIKTVLGSTGALNAREVVSAIVATRESSEFIARRLWLRYAGNEPDDVVIAQIADQIAGNGTIKAGLRTLLTHDAFYSDEVRHSLVAQPVEILIRVARNFDHPITRVDVNSLNINDNGEILDDIWGAESINWWATLMGQPPTAPPNVAGWPHNDAWLDANRSAARVRAARDLGWSIFGDGQPRSDVADWMLGIEDPRQLADAILRQLGLVEWSDETFEAVVTAANADGWISHDFAFTTAFVSPEVVLS